jgi:serpin B
MRIRLVPCAFLLTAAACGSSQDSPFGPSGHDADRGNRSGPSGRDARTEAAPATPPAGPANAQGQQLVASGNAFGFDVYARLRKTPGNLAFSPASLGMGLLLPWGGARGETEAAFRKVLHLSGSPAELLPAWGQLVATVQDPSRRATLHVANRLFGEKSYTFQTAYLEATKAAFGTGLEPVDFRGAPQEARSSINAWVEEQTEDRIRDLVPASGVSKDTRLVLVNALYFLGRWKKAFEAEATRPAPFHAAAGASRDVPTMHRTGAFPFAARDGLKALEMPYEGEGLSMLILLPNAVDGLGAIEDSLDAATLDRITGTLAPTRVAVALPKFEVNPSESLALADTLKSLGLAVAFDRDRADFTGIANPPDPDDRLVLDDVFHKAFVRVDEAGTEAAAATATSMVRAASAPAPPEAEFQADHPFLFVLRDTATGLVLFMGRVADPVVPAS